MRALEQFICRNWIWLTIGIVLTRVAVEAAYNERGRIAIGGEWLILPTILLTVYFVRGMKETVIELLEAGREEDDD